MCSKHHPFINKKIQELMKCVLLANKPNEINITENRLSHYNVYIMYTTSMWHVTYRIPFMLLGTWDLHFSFLHLPCVQLVSVKHSCINWFSWFYCSVLLLLNAIYFFIFVLFPSAAIFMLDFLKNLLLFYFANVTYHKFYWFQF